MDSVGNRKLMSVGKIKNVNLSGGAVIPHEKTQNEKKDYSRGMEIFERNERLKTAQMIEKAKYKETFDNVGNVTEQKSTVIRQYTMKLDKPSSHNNEKDKRFLETKPSVNTLNRDAINNNNSEQEVKLNVKHNKHVSINPFSNQIGIDEIDQRMLRSYKDEKANNLVSFDDSPEVKANESMKTKMRDVVNRDKLVNLVYEDTDEDHVKGDDVYNVDIEHNVSDVHRDEGIPLNKMLSGENSNKSEFLKKAVPSIPFMIDNEIRDRYPGYDCFFSIDRHMSSDDWYIIDEIMKSSFQDKDFVDINKFNQSEMDIV